MGILKNLTACYTQPNILTIFYKHVCFFLMTKINGRANEHAVNKEIVQASKDGLIFSHSTRLSSGNYGFAIIYFCRSWQLRR